MKCPQCHTENLKASSYCSDCGTGLRDQTKRGSFLAGRYQVIEELGRSPEPAVEAPLKNLNPECNFCGQDVFNH